ncbi:Nucleoside diphosphate kinase -like protein 5 [Trichinella sp. T9]|nr:Nucleoside diphosphate kinase -like protein 5 [Trichinella sp. T9]
MMNTDTDQMSKSEGKVLESTLALIKSNALHLAEEIEKEIIQRDLTIAKKKTVRLNEEQCIDFYMDMARSASFDQVVRQLSSGEAIAMVLEGRRAIGTWKNIIQKLDNAPFENYHQLHVDKECLHASDDYFKARREIQFIFPEVQLVPWNEEVQHYLQEEVIPTMSRALEELARTNPIDPLVNVIFNAKLFFSFFIHRNGLQAGFGDTILREANLPLLTIIK